MIEPRTDRVTERVARAIRDQYVTLHPAAQVMAYRYNGWSISVRVIDPNFEGLTTRERHEPLEAIFRGLPEKVEERIYGLLAVTPEEARESPTSAEFDAVAKALAKKKTPTRNGRAKSGRK